MATVEPFCGIRYNRDKIESLADVVTPPYDIISGMQQSGYYERSPFNIIRIELGRTSPGDNRNDNAHTRARRYLQEWRTRGVLIRDRKAAYYLTATHYGAGSATATRWGLIAQVGLEPFSPQGNILPHEKTFPQIKSERLGLMRACGLNTSPIFALFSDTAHLMDHLRSHVDGLAPLQAFEDENGHHHRIWRLTDLKTNAEIKAGFRDRRLYIADGHHRYETCLAYQAECARNAANFNPAHPANATLMYISSMQDPGLQVLPTHRMLPRVAPRLQTAFLERARTYFDCQPIAVSPGRSREATRELCAALDQVPAEHGLGVVLHGDDRLHLLRLRPDARARIYSADTPVLLRQLNVTLLSDFVFPQLLEMDSAQLEDSESIHFGHSAVEVVAGVRRGAQAMAFILRPTPVDKVRAIAEAGLSMPRKTTYFAPKVITGLVMRALADTA